LELLLKVKQRHKEREEAMHIKDVQSLAMEIEMLKVLLYWWRGKVETRKRLNDSR
jgi:hypothetical protein